MILITGGAYQGKTAYVKAHFQHEITDGAVCMFDTAKSAAILTNYHMLIRRLTESGMDAESFTRAFCSENPDCIVLLDEIGSGIIPMEKQERIWRETVGKAGCILAENSEAVIRLLCGIPTAIKGELL